VSRPFPARRNRSDGSAAPTPHPWLAYLRVPDVDEALRRAEAAGATPAGVSGVDGRFARIIDPQGAALGLEPDG
jgi:predicted enzyme related to lactoylglutathione lyase